MTVRELLDCVSAIKGVSVHFKWVEGRMVLIFWKGHSPIASVFVDEHEYRKDYPKFIISRIIRITNKIKTPA